MDILNCDDYDLQLNQLCEDVERENNEDKQLYNVCENLSQHQYNISSQDGGGLKRQTTTSEIEECPPTKKKYGPSTSRYDETTPPQASDTNIQRETRSPSPASFHSEILPARTPTQITGPLCFSTPSDSSGSYIASEPPFVSPLLQFQMPLQPRTYQPSRVYHRVNRGTQRQQPYRLPSLNDRIYNRSFLPVLQEEESLQLTVPSGDVVIERNYGMSAKRRGRVTYMCASCNEPIQVRDRYEMAVESEGTQRVPSRWPPTNEQTSIFASDFINNSSDEDRSVTGNELQNRLSSTSLTQSFALPRFESPATHSYTAPSVHETSVPNSNTNNGPNSANQGSLSDMQQHTSSSSLSEKTDCELSNHDRSPDETSGVNVEFRASAMSCRTGGSVPSMPAASAHARQVANRVIRHARDNKVPDDRAMCCPDCGLFPALPVTGQCGHTRCTKCILYYGTCPCGAQPPKELHVNTLIQDIIVKMLRSQSPSRRATKSVSGRKQRASALKPLKTAGTRAGWSSSARQRITSGPQGPLMSSKSLQTKASLTSHTPMSPKARFKLAKELLVSGRGSEAAPLLARVAASAEPLALARLARTLLAQTIGVLSQGRDPRRLTRELFRAVRVQSASTWLKATDLECVLCYHTYTRPVTTPCGHTYCRTCIERSMDYKKSCALCLRNLEDFDLNAANETAFICAALSSIGALNPPPPPDPNVIPIFVCTVAYPSIPCPLFIFDPRYWLMIRRVLESGSRKFGMVAYERDRTYSDYGTVLEVCDCVHLEDGRSILSTVGVSRFRVIERDVRDGCDVARIQPLTDIPPTEDLVILDLRIMATHIKYKALLWLKNMNRTVRTEIESAFGLIPHFGHRGEDWWETSDGPAWLWWLIAILPLRSEIKVLILSTKNLLKRMMAVSRTLEAIDHVAITRTASSACELQSALTNAEEWLERSA